MAFKSLDLSPFARGDTWTTKFTLTDSSNTPLDITGFTYWLTLKINQDDADPGVAQQSVLATGTDATNGIVYITFQPSVTYTLTPRRYYYDLQQVDPTSGSPAQITTLLIGKVKVATDITRTA